jgi:hypothetical protein
MSVSRMRNSSEAAASGAPRARAGLSSSSALRLLFPLVAA